MFHMQTFCKAAHFYTSRLRLVLLYKYHFSFNGCLLNIAYSLCIIYTTCFQCFNISCGEGLALSKSNISSKEKNVELLQTQIMFNFIVHTIGNLKMTSLPAVRTIVNMWQILKTTFRRWKKVHCLAHKERLASTTIYLWEKIFWQDFSRVAWVRRRRARGWQRGRSPWWPPEWGRPLWSVSARDAKHVRECAWESWENLQIVFWILHLIWKALKQPNLVIWVELRHIARGCCIVAPPVEHVMRLGTYGLSSQKETKVTKLACRIGQWRFVCFRALSSEKCWNF